MKQKAVKKTLRSQLGMISMIGYLTVIVLLLIFDYFIIYGYVNRFEEKNTALLSEYVGAVDDAIDKANQITLRIYYENTDFQVLTYIDDPVECYTRTYQLMSLLEDQMLTNRELSGVIVYYEKQAKRRYDFREDVGSTQVDEILEETQRQLENNRIMKTQFMVMSGEHVYYVQLLNCNGAAIAGVTDLTDQMSAEQTASDDTYILTYGKVILNHQEEAEALGIKDSSTEVDDGLALFDDAKIYRADCVQEEMAVYLVTDSQQIQVLRLQIFGMILLTILVIVFVIIVYCFLNRQILRPLKLLAERMEAIGRRRQSERMPSIAPYAEFEQVTDSFNGMMDEIEQLKISSYEEQIAKQKAQMQCFQLQLSPHFYLNCLKVLNFMAIQKETDNMQELIFEISAHLRYLLKNEEELVTVAEEIENVKSYVHLQQLISSRKVECAIHIDPELSECRIPILSIQIFVENAFKYAVPPDEKSVLHISVRGVALETENGKMMDFAVEDNGAGFREDVLELINAISQEKMTYTTSETSAREDQTGQKNRTEETDRRTETADYRTEETVHRAETAVHRTAAVGIRNVTQRCRLLYGDRAEIMFYNMQGAVSEFILPWDDGGEKNECIGD